MALRLPKVEGYRPSHRFISAGGREFHVAEIGEGPPVLLLHGFPQHWYSWRLVIPALSGTHTVMAMDLRGFGWSEIAWEGFDKETMASDVLGVIDALGLDRVHIVGHDWGGWIAYLLALQHPERVERLMTLNAPLPFARPTPAHAVGLIRPHHLLMASPLSPRILKLRPYVAWSLRRRSRGNANLPGPVRDRYWLDIRASTRARAAMLLHRSWVRDEAVRVLAGRYRSERLTTPTLALFGERDPVTPPRLVADDGRHADDLRVEGVPGAGHLLPEERPDLVAERALEFFGT